MAIDKTTRLSHLERAGRALKRHLKSADANHDGRVSNDEVQGYARSLSDFRLGRALVTFHSWALRDLDRSSSAAVSHVQQKVDDALQLFEQKDLDGDGVIDPGKEFNSVKRLKTYQALAGMVGEVKLDAPALGKALAPHAEKAVFISESDYSPQFFSVPLNSEGMLTADLAFAKLGPTLDKFFEYPSPTGTTFEQYSARDARDFLAELAEPYDPTDPDAVESAQAFAQVVKLLKGNLSDLMVLNVGPKDDQTGGLAVDQGLYARVIVGRAMDGRLAGVLIGSVET